MLAQVGTGRQAAQHRELGALAGHDPCWRGEQQERLGHATIGITLDTYSHVVGSLQREAADRLDELLG